MRNNDSKVFELFARSIIATSYNKKYNDLIWQEKNDDFDFVDNKRSIGLEVTQFLSKNEIEINKYEASYKRGNYPDKSKIKMGHFSDNGKLLWGFGASLDEMKIGILDRLKEKLDKLENRIKKDHSKTCGEYNICICLQDGGLFIEKLNFDYLLEYINDDGYNNLSYKFSKIFIICRCSFFLITKDGIYSYERKYDSQYLDSKDND